MSFVNFHLCLKKGKGSGEIEEIGGKSLPTGLFPCLENNWWTVIMVRTSLGQGKTVYSCYKCIWKECLNVTMNAKKKEQGMFNSKFNPVTVSKLMWYKRNKALRDVLQFWHLLWIIIIYSTKLYDRLCCY